MPDSLSVLVIEDNPADFLLAERYLQRHGLDVRCRRVACIDTLNTALVAGGWDLVLADYRLPGLRFEDALALIRSRRPDLPVVLISGSVGEETAVELLRCGVSDFVLKHNLVRLVPAVERALRDAATQRARQAAEARLRESEERLRLTLEAAEIVAWEIALPGMDIFESGPIGVVFGQSPGFRHESGGALMAGVHPEDREHLREQFRAAIGDGRLETFSTEFRIHDRAGETRWIATTGKLVPNGTDPPLRMLGIARDVTERKMAEDAAQRANAELLHASRLSVLGEVATTIAHEVNQPIGAARNYLQVARLGIADSAVIAVLDKLDAQLTRAAATVRRVREFASHHALDVRRESVRSLVAEACALGLLGTPDGKVQVTTTIPENLPRVMVDRIRIQQILVNLLRNAVEATANGPRKEIHLSASPAPDGPLVILSVADSGPGIAEDIRNRLFTAFTTTKPNGTGLGLSISRSIAEAHGGRLWAEDRPGGGTVFRLTLPTGESGHA